MEDVQGVVHRVGRVLLEVPPCTSTGTGTVFILPANGCGYALPPEDAADFEAATDEEGNGGTPCVLPWNPRGRPGKGIGNDANPFVALY